VPQLLCESPKPLAVHRTILACAWLGWIFDFYDLTLITFLVASTPLTRDLGLSRPDMAVVLGASLGFTAFGGLICGMLADRYGRKPLLMGTILVYSLGTCISGLATGWWSLMLARAITGLGVGGEWAVAHALVGETVPPRMRGRYGSYLQTGATFGLFLATLVGNYAGPRIGWRWCFLLSALPALLVVFIRRSMPESDIWQSRPRRGGLMEMTALFGPRLRKATLLAFSVTVCAMAAYWIKTIWLPTYFRETRGLSLDASSRLFFVGQLGSLTGYILSGFASDRFGRRPAYSIFAACKALGMLMITVGWALASVHPLLLFGCMFLVGVGEGNWGAVGPLLNELFPTEVRAAALGMIYNFARGAQFVAPIMIAQVAARYSFAEALAPAALFALLSGALVWALPETKGVSLTSPRAVAAGAASEQRS